MATSGLENRQAPLSMSPEEFRAAGHRLVDEIAGFLESLKHRPPNKDEAPSALRALLPARLEEGGHDASRLLAETVPLLLEHSLFNGASPLLRLHHVLAGPDRRTGGPARRGREPQPGRLAALADRVGDRGPVGALDRRADRACRTRPRACS